jgi:hypothetical protein
MSVRTPSEILALRQELKALTAQTWWEHEARRRGLPWPPARVGPSRIERGPGSYKRKPARDYLSEPVDFLSLPLEVLKRRT